MTIPLCVNESPSRIFRRNPFTIPDVWPLLFACLPACVFVCVADVCVALVEPPAKRVRVEEAFQLSERQQELIKEDTPNKKVWDEALNFLGEGPV